MEGELESFWNISGDARVFDNACVYGNARTNYKAKIFGNSLTCNYGTIFY